MPIDLHNRSFLALRDFTPDEIGFLLHLAADLKAAKRAGTEVRHLVGREIVLIFEKDSTRTRVGFEVAAYDQGAHVTYLGPSGSHIGKKETVKDTARVLGRVYDAIEYRGYGQKIVEELAQWAGVPVYNGLTDEFHPTQVLADLLTMREHSDRPLNDLALCFLGDTGNNMGDSLMIGGCKMGMDVRLCGPRTLWPKPALVADARNIAEQTGAKLTLTEDVSAGVARADFLYTDVWVSMGEPEAVWASRVAALLAIAIFGGVMASVFDGALDDALRSAGLPDPLVPHVHAQRGRCHASRQIGRNRGAVMRQAQQQRRVAALELEYRWLGHGCRRYGISRTLRAAATASSPRVVRP